MPYTGEEKAMLWLSACEVDASIYWRWFEQYGSAQAIYNAFGSPDFPTELAQTRSRLAQLREPGQLDRYIERLEKHRIFTLFPHSEVYPRMLRYLSDKPYALYCVGDMEAIRHSCVSIVGTRRPSDYGRRMAHSLASDLAREGVTVVSGMAMGIDAQAHQGALDAGGLTVAVLGTGLNVPYPACNETLYHRILEQGSLLVSELPLDSQPLAYHFPRRNRIISGLSHGLVFVEGQIKSGGMVTVGLALSQGREVFAVPGHVGYSVSEGPHTILREGARIITSGADLIEDIGELLTNRRARRPAASGDTGEELTDRQRHILSALRTEAMDMTQLAARTGLPDETVQVETAMMEISGLIAREAGNRYALSKGVKQTFGEEL